MTYPISTGQAAQLLGVTEPQLNLLIRKRRLASIPIVAAGRRMWHEEHVLLAADALKIPRADPIRRFSQFERLSAPQALAT